MTEAISMKKEHFFSLMDNFDTLIENFEEIAEDSINELASKRIKSIDSGKVKGKTEKEFAEFMKTYLNVFE